MKPFARTMAVFALCCGLHAVQTARAANPRGVDAAVADAAHVAKRSDDVAVAARVANPPEAVTAVAIGANVANAPSAPDAAVAAHAQKLAERFRCLVCQNETLADSTAELAADLRGKIVDQLERGATDAQVREYMVRRYGDFVLYDPPFKPHTWLLWLGPFALLLAGAFALLRIVRQRRAMHTPPLTDAERRRVDALLRHTPKDLAR